MASRTVKVDDLDGKTEGAETVVFGAAGEWFEIDLADANVKKLTDALEPFTAKARQIEAREALKGGNGGGYSPSLVRSWANANGKNLGDRGRVPQSVVEEWRKATGN